MPESFRHPLLDDSGRAQLEKWREHPRAPRWNTACGDRLDAPALEDVRLFARTCSAPPGWGSFAEPPRWARQFARRCLREVPFYRGRGGSEHDWSSISPCDRLDLAREPWHFVPDGLEIDDLVVYNTSGTTGSEVLIPAHPRWPSMYLPLYERALRLNAVDWADARQAEPERVSIATIAAQEHTLTFAAWSSYVGGANLKVNLHAGQWRAPEDATAFLDEANPLVLCGDPVSLGALAQTEFARRPLAIISSALAMAPAVRGEMRARFGCPIIDLYSMNESGPIAASVPASTCEEHSGAMAVLAPDLWIEILRPDGSPVAPGEIGEITLSGGRNLFLPLLRYRTGDRARGQVLEEDGKAAPHLLDFHGRALVKFESRAASGTREILDIDVTHSLRHLPLREFSLRQNPDASLLFQFRGLAEPSDIEAILRAVFPDNALRIEELSSWSGERKLIRYSRG